MTVTAAAKTRARVSRDVFRALNNSLCLLVKNHLVLLIIIIIIRVSTDMTVTAGAKTRARVTVGGSGLCCVRVASSGH